MATEAATNVASPGAAAAAVANAAAASVEAPAATPPPAEAAPEAPTPPPEEPKPAPKEDVDFSTRFAALSKRERALTEREKALKASEKELSDFKKAREQAKLDPAALLEAHGISYDDVTQFLLNDRKLTEGQRLALLEERIAKEAAERDRLAKEAEASQVSEVIAGHKQAIKDFVDQGGDTYELTRAHDAYELIYEVIEAHWSETEQILPIESAAKAVEDHLEKMAREKVLKLKRFQPKQDVSNEAAQATPQPNGVVPETPRPAPTLTNSAVASASLPSESDDRRGLSDEESKRRSAQMLRQMLGRK